MTNRARQRKFARLRSCLPFRPGHSRRQLKQDRRLRAILDATTHRARTFLRPSSGQDVLDLRTSDPCGAQSHPRRRLASHRSHPLQSVHARSHGDGKRFPTAEATSKHMKCSAYVHHFLRSQVAGMSRSVGRLRLSRHLPLGQDSHDHKVRPTNHRGLKPAGSN